MKGIILAGGKGTRLQPLTIGLSKQLLPVYNKPMIYYPLSILMLSEITEILIISTPEHINLYKDLLGDGKHLGIKLSYAIQKSPKGLAEAFIIGKDFVGSENVALILGDNIFHSEGLISILKNSITDAKSTKSSNIFGFKVSQPKNFGVVECNKENKIISIEEKPKNPKSDIAIVGLYIFPSDVVEIAQKIEPSQRGELEITSILDYYLKNDRIKLNLLGRGFSWFDTGTHKSLLEASNFISTIEGIHGKMVGCIEEISYQNGWITSKKLKEIAKRFPNEYGKYLLSLTKSLSKK